MPILKVIPAAECESEIRFALLTQFEFSKYLIN